MSFQNTINANQQGTQYFSTAGAWVGVDGGAAGQILTSNGTGLAPSFQASGGGGGNINAYVLANLPGVPFIYNQFNIASITNLGGGIFQINFVTPMASADYIIFLQSMGSAAGIGAFPDATQVISNKLTTSFRFQTGATSIYLLVVGG